MSADDKLYLRMTGGKIFGPIDLPTLRQWVVDGRVEPSAAVSGDRVEWTRATEIPELEMEWVVENSPGQFYGPTHRAVVDDFIKSGALVATARFYRDMRSGLAERADAEAAVADVEGRLAVREQALVEAQGRLADQEYALSDAKTRLADQEQALSDAKTRLADQEQALSAVKVELAALETDIQSLKAGKQSLEADKRTLESDKRMLESEKRTLEADKRALSGEKDRLEGELKRLEADNECRQCELDAANARQGELEKELAGAKKELEELKRQREAEAEAENVLVPEVVVEGAPPPKAQSAFARPAVAPAVSKSAPHASFGDASPFGGANPTSLADLERAAQAELARMRASGAKGFFFGRKK